MSNDKIKQLAEGPVFSTMMKIAVPSFIGLVAVQVCNIIVQIFVGRFISDGALTAVSNYLPTEQFFFGNVMTSIGTGAAAMISGALGNNDLPYATQIQGQLFIITLITAIMLVIIFMPWLPLYLTLLGTTESILQDCLNYAWIATAFLPFAYGMNFSLSNIFRCYNKAGLVMWRQIFGSILNLIMNLILVIWLRLGTMGASIASVVSYIIPGIWILCYFASKKATIPLKCSHFRFNFKIIWNILALGSSTLGSYVPMALQAILSPLLLKHFSETEEQVKRLQMIAGITTSITRLFTLPLSGLVFGVPPLLGYALGAKNVPRVKSILKLAYIIIFGFSSFLFVLILVFAKPIISLFSRTTEIYDEAAFLMRISVSGILMNNFVFLATTILQQEKKAFQALLIQVIRAATAIFVQIGLPWLTHRPDMMFLSSPVGDVVGGFFGVGCMFYFFRKYDVCCAKNKQGVSEIQSDVSISESQKQGEGLLVVA